MAAKSASESILEAAEAIVVEQGASFMTMDAVAARAGVSKGGLIYHFPSQESLMSALIQRFTDHLQQRREEIRASLPESPARDLVSYILARGDCAAEACRMGGGLMAAAMRAPQLVEPAKAACKKAIEQILQGAENRSRLMVLVLAADCIWLIRLLGMQAFTDEELGQMRDEIVKLAYEWGGG